MVAALALVSAGFAGLIVLERQDAAGVAARVAPAAAPAPPPANAVAPAGATPAAVATILARPLFEPGRRPVAAPAAGPAMAEGLPRLTGVLVTPAGRSVIFAGAAGGRSVTATEGTRIGAYTVQSIGAGEVTVLGPDGVHTLRPSFDPNRARSEPATATVAPRSPDAGGAVPPRPVVMPPGFTPPANPDTITLPLQAPS